MSRARRHAVLLRLVRTERVTSQEALRELLSRRGFEVTQTTLSRDLRELGVVKAPQQDGGSAYEVGAGRADPKPTLERLLPALFTDVEGVDNLVVIKTLTGGAQPVAVALDRQGWKEVLGTISGDDTILLVLRDARRRKTIERRIRELAGTEE
ncbi:MAG TPA: arginine repressor [Longimicrobiales bacterium]|nr:arginine repressor [Longimicrobiales bacterium]